MNKTLQWGAIIVGLLFIAMAIMYWTTPAGGLPSYVPGYIAGAGNVHVKHGIASFVLGLLCFAFAWFKSGPTRA